MVVGERKLHQPDAEAIRVRHSQRKEQPLQHPLGVALVGRLVRQTSERRQGESLSRKFRPWQEGLPLGESIQPDAHLWRGALLAPDPLLRGEGRAACAL